MPLLLDAAVHRFAEGYLLDMTEQVLDDVRCERQFYRDLAHFYQTMNDLVDFHRVCARLADDWDSNWSHDSVVHCNGDAHEAAEMLFGRLLREQEDEWRFGRLHSFHGLVLCVSEGMSISEKNALFITKGEGKGKKGEGKGKKGEGKGKKGKGKKGEESEIFREALRFSSFREVAAAAEEVAAAAEVARRRRRPRGGGG